MLLEAIQTEDSTMSADRDLLLGMLALQNGFVERAELLAAFDRWLHDKSKPLGAHLVALGHMNQGRCELLESLVDEHVRHHGNDATRSLRTLSGIGASLRNELLGCDDPQLNQSLQRIAASDSQWGTLTETWHARSSSGLRYTVLRAHAEGGLGIVSIARDEELHREVAFKEIKHDIAGDELCRARFVLEAEITGGLEHPGIVPVYGLGQFTDGRPFYAMRFIRGTTLKQAIAEFHASRRNSGGRSNWLLLRQLLTRFIDVCQAIEYAHSRGVLHRDLKPGNIMLGNYGETLVVDWGVAKVAGRDDSHGSSLEHTLRPQSGSGLLPTQAGSAVGTPAYMSPEQAAGRINELGPSTDIYSLGATLYHLLTDSPPVTEKNLGDLLRRVERGDFPSAKQKSAWIPGALDAICLKAMRVDPSQRYRSAGELADDLERWLADEQVAAWREPWWDRVARWTRKHRGLMFASVVSATLLSAVALGAAMRVTTTRTSGETSLDVADGKALTFNKDNWNVPQIVRIASAEDFNVTNGIAEFTSTSPTWIDGKVTATQLDTANRIVLSAINLAVPEAASKTVSVRLSTIPASDVTVSIARILGDSDLAVDGSTTLTFNVSNWDKDQTVTIRSLNDADGIDGTTDFKFTSTGWVPGTVRAVEIDDDRRLIASAANVVVGEGSTATFGIRLNALPAADVTVTVGRYSGNSGLTIDGLDTLRFTRDNWDQPQVVTVRAGDDEDAVDDKAQLTADATDWTSATVTASSLDDDRYVISSVSALSVAEGQLSSYLVKLAGRPASDIVLTTTAAQPEISIAAGGALTFTPENWNEYQQIQVRGQEDLDAMDETVSVQSTSVGWTPSFLAVTQLDDDRRIEFSVPLGTVAELGSVTIGVRLAGAPASSIVVQLTPRDGDEDLQISSTPNLTFTPTDWSTYQYFTVSAADDSDVIDGIAQFLATATGWSDASVLLQEVDDDLRFEFESTHVDVPEEGSATLRLRLRGRPDAPLTVTTTRVSGDADISVNQGQTLLFTPDNWGTFQELRFSDSADQDSVDGGATFETSAPGWVTTTLSALEVDNDRRMEFDRRSLSVDENSKGTVRVRLVAPPGENVQITARINGDSDFHLVSTNPLSFNTSNWNQFQPIEISSEIDADAIVDSATLELTAVNYQTGTLSLFEIERDIVGVSVVPTAGSTTVVEPNPLAIQSAPPSDQYSVVLKSKPRSDVVVTANFGTELLVSPTQLTFTPLNWNVAQTVVVTALDDLRAEGDVLARIQYSVDSDDQAFDNIAVESVDVTIIDNDIPGVVLQNHVGLRTTEAGSAAVFRMNLATPPSSDVRIDFASSDSSEGTVAPKFLTFTKLNWNVAQAVTVTGEDDELDDGDVWFQVITSAVDSLDPAYASMEIDDVPVVNIDDDAAFVVSKSSLTINEGGTGSFTVRLREAPSASVSVSVSRISGDSDVSVQSGASLVFTTANWSTTQSVTVAADTDSDGIDGVSTFRVAATGWIDSLVTIAERDDDRALEFESASKLIAADGRTDIGVRLKSLPAGDVLVWNSWSGGTSKVSVYDGEALHFDASNWNLFQPVTVFAAGLLRGETAQLQAVATDWATSQITVSAPAIGVSVSDLVVDEGRTGSFGVRLLSAPPADLVVTTQRASGDADIRIASGETLTFTPANWSSYQFVTVTANEDLDRSDGSAILDVSARGWIGEKVTVHENDNDRAVAFSSTEVAIPEFGSIAVGIRPLAEPAGELVVTTRRVSGSSSLRVDQGAELRFDRTNWSEYQFVTFAAGALAATDSARFEASAPGWASSGLDVVPQTLQVSVSSLTVDEGSSQIFDVRLLRAPKSNVTVTTTRTAGDSDLTVLSGATLTFTPANWSIPQSVAIAATNDADGGNGTAQFSVSAPGWISGSVTVFESDDDRALDLSSSSVLVPSNGTALIGVRLAAQPDAMVSVNVTRASGSTKISVSAGASLTFDSENWNTYQYATLAATTLDRPDTATIRASATNWGSIDAMVLPQVLEVDRSAVVASEAGSSSFTVRLLSPPTADVTVTSQRNSGDGDLTVTSGATLLFTPTNWALPQTVVVSAGADADAIDGTATISIAAPGWVGATVNATESDDDRALVFAKPTVYVPIDGSVVVGMQLAAEPASTVTVSIVRDSGTSAISVADGSSLVFSRSNWNISQNVVLSATSLTAADSATIRATAADWRDASVTVLPQIISLTLSDLTVSEGASGSFEVRLMNEPQAPVTVSTSRISGDSDLSPAAGGTLTFDASNWSVPQQVTLQARDDNDATDGRARFDVAALGWIGSSINVQEADDDRRLIVAPTQVTMGAQTTKSVAVRLAGAPDNVVFVRTAKISGPNSIQVQSGSELQFDATNWDVTQNVVLSAQAISSAAPDTFRTEATDWQGSDILVTPQYGWQNPRDPLDVDNNKLIAPADVVLIINRLNALGSGPLPAPEPPNVPPPYYDVNGDKLITPGDAILVINFLNSRAHGEGDSPLDAFVLSAELASHDSRAAGESASPRSENVELLSMPRQFGDNLPTIEDRNLVNSLTEPYERDRVFSPSEPLFHAELEQILESLVADVHRRWGKR